MALALSVVAILGGLLAVAPWTAQAEVDVSVGNFDFTTQTAPVPTGYIRDYGQAYDASRGYGWVEQGTHVPWDASLNGRQRKVETDPRTDTFMFMQYCCDARTGTVQPVSWEKAVPAGVYDVTVAVGDPTPSASTDRITVEGTVAIDNFIETTTSTVVHQTATVRVTVTDGELTLDATGGKNTKIDYVDIAEVQKQITSVAPTNGSTGVSPSTSMTMVSEVPVGVASLTAANIVVTAAGTVVPASLSLDSTGTVITVDPLADLPQNAVVSVAANGLRTTTNQAIQPITSTFSTSGANPQPGRLGVLTTEQFLGVGPRTVFSTVANDPRAAKPIVIADTGPGLLQITNLTFSGPQAAYFALDPGQPTSFTLAPGGSTSVNVSFRPTAQQVENYAQFTISSTDPVTPSAVVQLSAINSIAYEGNNEPRVSQIVRVLGWTTNIGSESTLLSKSPLPVGDEIISAGWKQANPGQPVGLTPVAHYSTRSAAESGATGWYVKPPGTQSALPTRNYLHDFAGGTDPSGGQNQRLLPVPTGVTSFNPAGQTIGIYGAFGDFIDDRFNTGALHNFRAYPVKGANGVPVPNAYLLILDPTSTAKNYDYNDYMWMLTNVVPEKPTAAAVPYLYNAFSAATPGTIADKAGQGTGFTSVEANTAGTQYQPADVSLSGGYLSIVPRAGTSTGLTNTLQNGLELSWNAASKNIVHSQVKIATSPLPTVGVRDTGVAFGPDQDDQARIVLEDTPSGRQLVFDSEEGGVVTPLATVPIANPTTVASVELRIDDNYTTATVGAEYRITVTGQATPAAFTTLAATHVVYDRMGWWSTDARTTLLAHGTTGETTPVRFDSFTLTT